MPSVARRLLLPVCLLAATTVSAQSPGDLPASTYIAVAPNANVLRGIHDPFSGDVLLQRQNEPVAAASTRNPNHIFVAANDYRTVDLPNDQGIGDSITRVARVVMHSLGEFVAKLTGRKEFADGDEAIEKVEAGAEAWIGMYLSNDGGRSYTSFLMPGYPQDPTSVGRSVPIHGRQAASDPVLAAAPAGRFYLGAMAFDRDPVTNEPTFSQVAVSSFTDRNNSETGENFHFDGMTLVDNGTESGRKFLDKPAIAADVPRSSADPNACGPVYISFTVFDQKEKDPMERSKILFSASYDCGAHFSALKKISHRSQLNQGVALAIRPSDGAIFAAYRSFSENKIYLTSSTDGGRSFTPAQIISGPQPILAFDQPTLTAADGYAFRTNAMPTIAIDGTGNIFVAWQERLVANGDPRIVITSSTDGRSWAPRQPVDPTRCTPTTPGAPPICGPTEVGPQVMPTLSFTRGKMMLLFYEGRPHLDDVKYVASQNAWYITGLEAELSVRVSQLDATGLGASVVVNHYDLDVDGNVLPVISFNPDGSVKYRAANRPNLPMYAGGTSPFMGDYIALAPVSSFVPATPPPAGPDKPGRGLGLVKNSDSGGYWRWATDPTDGPSAAFVAAWGDNRDVVFPRDASGTPQINGDWTRYAPPGGGPCINPGARNANIYASILTPRLVAGTPTSFKQLGIQRAFVLFAQNQDVTAKWYRLTIVDTPPTVTASFYQFGAPRRVLYINVYPLSTVTQNVFAVGANGVATAPFRIDLAESSEPKFASDGSLVPGTGVPVTNGDMASVVFNGDQSNPSLADSSNELHTPRIFNPDDPTKTTPRITNPQVANPQVANPQVANPQVANPQVANPQVANSGVANPQVANFPLTNSTLVDPTTPVYGNVTNYTWQVSNAGNTVSAFTPVINIANQAALDGKKVTLYIYKSYKIPTFISQSGLCAAVEAPRDEIISVVQNPQVANPQVANPQVANPQVANPQVANATFAVAPTDATSGPTISSASLFQRLNPNATLAAFPASGSPDDALLTITDAATMIMLSVQDGDTPIPTPPPPPDPVTGLPPPIAPPLTTTDFTQNGSAVAITATSADVINGVTQTTPEAATTGPDLVIATPPTFSVAAGSSVPVDTPITFGATTVQNTGQEVASGGFKYGFYLSATSQIDPKTAVLLGSAVFTDDVAAGASVALAGATFAIPPSAPPGPYFIGIRINSGDPTLPTPEPHVFEPEDNDSATEAIAVVPGANLVITQVTLAPSTLYAGQTTTATARVQNAGTVSAAASTTTFVLSPGSTLLGSVATPALAAGASADVTVSLVIPGATPVGTDTLTANADATNVVPESNETDNSLATALRVVNNPTVLTFQQQPSQQPPATLVAAHLLAPVTVKVTDSTSAVVPGALVQLALNVVSGAGTLGGSLSAISDATGVATFAGLTISQAGTYQLGATAPTIGATAAVLSNAFTIVPDHAPTVHNHSYSVNANTTLNVPASSGVLSDASDADGDSLTASATPPSHGSVSMNADGSFTYNPVTGFAGADTFAFFVSDGILTSSGIVSITVISQPPTANNDGYSFSESADAGLVGYWPFNEGSGTTAFDLSAHGNNGSLMNGPAWSTDVPAGDPMTSLSFDGVSDWVEVPDSPSLEPSSGLTLSAWIKQTGPNLDTHGIISKPRPGSGTGWALRVEAGEANFALNNIGFGGSVNCSLHASAPLPQGTWVHLAATYANNVAKLYVNGLLVPNDGASCTGPLTVTNENLEIGREFPAGRYFLGVVDEARVYSHVLSDAEIATLASDWPLAVTAPNGVLTNDTDPNNLPLTAALTTAPLHGAAQMNADGSFTYKPVPGFVGEDTFTYQANNGTSLSNSATVFVNVLQVNQPAEFDLSSLLNADVVMNTTDPLTGPNSEKTAMDGSAYVLMTQSYASAESAGGSGLPDNGFFPANGEHPAVQLYATNAGDAPNARFSGTDGDAYTIAVPERPYNQIQIYATSTEGSTTVTFTLNYDDGTTDTRTVAIADWFTDPPNPGQSYLIDGLDRHSIGDGLTDPAHDPAIFVVNLNPDPSKALTSVDISKPAASSRLIVFAATGQ